MGQDKDLRKIFKDPQAKKKLLEFIKTDDFVKGKIITLDLMNGERIKVKIKESFQNSIRKNQPKPVFPLILILFLLGLTLIVLGILYA